MMKYCIAVCLAVLLVSCSGNKDPIARYPEIGLFLEICEEEPQNLTHDARHKLLECEFEALVESRDEFFDELDEYAKEEGWHVRVRVPGIQTYEKSTPETRKMRTKVVIAFDEDEGMVRLRLRRKKV